MTGPAPEGVDYRLVNIADPGSIGVAMESWYVPPHVADQVRALLGEPHAVVHMENDQLDAARAASGPMAAVMHPSLRRD